jgi:hypothetical protein
VSDSCMSGNGDNKQPISHLTSMYNIHIHATLYTYPLIHSPTHTNPLTHPHTPIHPPSPPHTPIHPLSPHTHPHPTTHRPTQQYPHIHLKSTHTQTPTCIHTHTHPSNTAHMYSPSHSDPHIHPNTHPHPHSHPYIHPYAYIYTPYNTFHFTFTSGDFSMLSIHAISVCMSCIYLPSDGAVKTMCLQYFKIEIVTQESTHEIDNIAECPEIKVKLNGLHLNIWTLLLLEMTDEKL